MSLDQLRVRLKQASAHYAAEAAGKTGALGDLYQDVVKEDWLDRLVSQYKGQDKSRFVETLERNWDRETKMGIEVTSGSVYRAESKSVLGDLEGRIAAMEKSAPSTPTKSKPKREFSTPVKAANIEPHKIINWHQPPDPPKRPTLIVKAQSAIVKQLEKRLQQAMLQGDYDAAEKIATSLASRFVETNTQLDPLFMKGIARQYKENLLSQARSGKKITGIASTVARQFQPKLKLKAALKGVKAGGSQPRAKTSPDDGLTTGQQFTTPLSGGQPKSHTIGVEPIEFTADSDEKWDGSVGDSASESGSEAWTDAPAASVGSQVVPIVPRTSRYVTLEAIKLRQRLNAKRSYGEASVVSVGTKAHFATSWGGLAHRERRIPLFYGEILISGHSAKITLTKSGKVAGGDIATINTFLKTFFLTGGSIKGKRMTSQQLIRHIMSHVPGVFSISA